MDAQGRMCFRHSEFAFRPKASSEKARRPQDAPFLTGVLVNL